MQLGNILSTATQPVICKPVIFRVLGEDSEGKQVSAKAEACFAFVDEDRREEYRRYAREWLESHDYKGKPVPMAVLDDEENRWFMLAALRDKDDPARQFCPNAEYGRFRRSIIARQLIWLFEQYGQFVRDEYPELATPEQQEQITEEAQSK